MKTVHILSDLELLVAAPGLAPCASPALLAPAPVLVDFDYVPQRGTLVRLADRVVEPGQQEALTVTRVVANSPLHLACPGLLLTVSEGVELSAYLSAPRAVQLELAMLRHARLLKDAA